MNKIDAVILVATLLGLSLIGFEIFAFRKRWRVRACLALLFGIPSFMLGGNAVPALSFAPHWMNVGAFRTAVCDAGPALVARHNVDPATGADPASELCATALMINMPAAASPTPIFNLAPCWRAIDRAALTDSTCYSFAALEFDDEGELLDPSQRRQLDHHIGKLSAVLGARYRASLQAKDVSAARVADKPGIYMMAFIHGWRHDARRNDENVRQFRLMVSNAARDVAARCEQAQRYCNTAVVGVYIGWRGSAGIVDYADSIKNIPIDKLEEGTFEESLLATVAGGFNGLTFPGRKLVSDKIGGSVLKELGDLRRAVETHFRDGPSHFLLIGHSLGGNMLLSATPLSHTTEASLGLPFDLTVLINPATETAKWRALAAKVKAHGWGATIAPRLIAMVSPPFYIDPVSLAELSKRDLSERQKNLFRQRRDAVNENYDTVVDRFFTASQLLMNGWPRSCEDDEQIFGLGHLLYREQQHKTDGVDRYLPKPNLCAGHESYLTHFVEVNSQSNTYVSGLSYRNARSPAHSCYVERGFLFCARARQRRFQNLCDKMPDIRELGSWDLGTLTDRTLGRTRDILLRGDVAMSRAVTEDNNLCLSQAKGREGLVAGRQQISVQFGTGYAPGKRSQRGEKFAPVWGARVLPQSLVNHGGFWTEPFACMFNKLVLDEPLGVLGSTATKEVDPYLRVVDRTQFKRTLTRECAALIPS